MAEVEERAPYICISPSSGENDCGLVQNASENSAASFHSLNFMGLLNSEVALHSLMKPRAEATDSSWLLSHSCTRPHPIK